MKELSLQEKMSIKMLLELGKKYPAIAATLNLNLRTVEKWELIIKKGGDINPPMGRHRTGRLSTFDKCIKDQIDYYRSSSFLRLLCTFVLRLLCTFLYYDFCTLHRGQTEKYSERFRNCQK